MPHNINIGGEQFLTIFQYLFYYLVTGLRSHNPISLFVQNGCHVSGITIKNSNICISCFLDIICNLYGITDIEFAFVQFVLIQIKFSVPHKT